MVSCRQINHSLAEDGLDDMITRTLRPVDFRNLRALLVVLLFLSEETVS